MKLIFMSMLDIAIKFKNYKCFAEEEQGFEKIYPLNIIIGRNNSGKSALLDLVHYFVSPFDTAQFAHKGKDSPEFFLYKKVETDEVSRSFDRNTSGGLIGENHYQYGIANILNNEIKVKVSKDYAYQFIELKPTPAINSTDHFQKLANNINNPIRGKISGKLLAERDIQPEKDRVDLVLGENGAGATNIIQSFINKSSLPSELVEKTLLESLNEIFYPDSHFSRILTQKLPNESWEIFFDEDKKGRIPLSNSGSGLKTIILVLANLILLPHLKGMGLKDFIFMFEELENNLHPGLQRKLLRFIEEKAIGDGCYIFLTTHSNILIDMFSKDPDSQLLHVIHSGEHAEVKKVHAYIDHTGVLDDLDVRASDILQANGVIWLEGPSDRLYVNKWIELFSDGKLREGSDYQCIFYGGRLLNHLCADDSSEKINILSVNRNAAILIDSDKRNVHQRINSTKKRMFDEVEKINGFAWVTKGKEIENYIPHETLKKVFGDQTSGISQFEGLDSYLSANNISIDKIALAERVCELLNKDSLRATLDLREKMNKLIAVISTWNKK